MPFGVLPSQECAFGVVRGMAHGQWDWRGAHQHPPDVDRRHVRSAHGFRWTEWVHGVESVGDVLMRLVRRAGMANPSPGCPGPSWRVRSPRFGQPLLAHPVPPRYRAFTRLAPRQCDPVASANKIFTAVRRLPKNTKRAALLTKHPARSDAKPARRSKVDRLERNEHLDAVKSRTRDPRPAAWREAASTPA